MLLQEPCGMEFNNWVSLRFVFVAVAGFLKRNTRGGECSSLRVCYFLAMDPTGKVNYSLWGKPAVLETAADMMFFMVPIWVALAIGFIVGWSWKPNWVSLIILGIRSRPRLVWETPPGFGARRLWLAMTAVSAFPILKEAWKKFSAWMWPLKDGADAFDSFSKAHVSRWVLWQGSIQYCILGFKVPCWEQVQWLLYLYPHFLMHPTTSARGYGCWCKCIFPLLAISASVFGENFCLAKIHDIELISLSILSYQRKSNTFRWSCEGDTRLLIAWCLLRVCGGKARAQWVGKMAVAIHSPHSNGESVMDGRPLDRFSTITSNFCGYGYSNGWACSQVNFFFKFE